ncbi:MAG TPA: outer membrane beta-barrel protein [Devosia sp.]|nr:outer membrane beta-barrel protein [Devosia sp.]
MNKLLVGLAWALVVGLGALPAAADDLAPSANTSANTVAVYDWSGLYLGANGGLGSSSSCWDFTTPAGLVTNHEGCHNATGGTLGGQIGYRWQSSNWVLGLEVQGNWANLNGQNISDAFPAYTNESRLDAFGLFTGQIGYAWDGTLLYLKGGAAVTSSRYQGLTTATGVPASDPVNNTAWGGVVGAGLEYGFAPNWSIGLEYDHIFMGGSSNRFVNNGTVGPAGTLFGTDTIHQDVDLVGLRLNFRF